MALVTTSLVLTGVLDLWKVPNNITESWIPRGEVVFAGSDVVAAKDAANESEILLQCNFPQSYVYRIQSIDYNVFSSTRAAGGLADLQGGVRVLVSSDALGFTDFSFSMHSANAFESDGLANPMYSFAASGVTNDNIRPYYPRATNASSEYPDTLIDASSDAARLLFALMDISSDATAALLMQYRVTALAYDIEQVRNWQVHSPMPVRQL